MVMMMVTMLMTEPSITMMTLPSGEGVAVTSGVGSGVASGVTSGIVSTGGIGVKLIIETICATMIFLGINVPVTVTVDPTTTLFSTLSLTSTERPATMIVPAPTWVTTP